MQDRFPLNTNTLRPKLHYTVLKQRSVEIIAVKSTDSTGLYSLFTAITLAGVPVIESSRMLIVDLSANENVCSIALNMYVEK